jgi:hypothetical protein
VKARLTVGLLIAALAVYFVLLTGRAVALLQTGDAVGILLGVGVLILPLLGVWLVYSNLRELEADGLLPDVSDLPRRPSGRVDRDAADSWFEERRAEVEASPEDWRAWFRLAYAYDIAGDRGRARETMRKAIQLHA